MFQHYHDLATTILSPYGFTLDTHSAAYIHQSAKKVCALSTLT